MSDKSEFSDPISIDYQHTHKISKGLKEYQTENEKRVTSVEEELKKIKEKWDSFFTDLANDKERQLSPNQIFKMKKNLRTDERLIYNHYIQYIHDGMKKEEIFKDSWSFFIHTDSKIDISVQKGEQNYRNQMQKQSMEKLSTYGKFLKDIKFNVMSFIFGIIGTLGVLFLGHWI